MQKVISAFFSFLQEKQFVLRFVFVFFIVFWHLISSIEILIVWVQTLTMAQTCHITCTFNIWEKLNFTQTVTHDILAFTWLIGFIFFFQQRSCKAFWIILNKRTKPPKMMYERIMCKIHFNGFAHKIGDILNDEHIDNLCDTFVSSHFYSF